MSQLKLGLGLGLNRSRGGSYDPDATAFIQAAAITDLTQRKAVNALVTGLKAQSLWTKMKVIYPFVGGTDATHKFNLKNPADSDAAFRIIWNGSVTHDANGIQSNGVNGYGDTKYNPSAQSDSLTSFSIGLFKKGIEADETTRVYFGHGKGSSGWNRTTVGWVFNGSRVAGMIGGSVDGSTDYAPNGTNVQGTGVLSVNTNGNRAAQFWRNGEKVGTAVTQTAAFENNSLFLLAQNIDNTAAAYCLNAVISFAYVSTGLSDSEVAALHTLVHAFQTALGRGV